MKILSFVAVSLLLTLAGCKKGGVCVVTTDTLRGPEKECQYGVSYELDQGLCDAYGGTFSPYSAGSGSLTDRGTDTCRAVAPGVTPRPK